MMLQYEEFTEFLGGHLTVDGFKKKKKKQNNGIILVQHFSDFVGI